MTYYGSTILGVDGEFHQHLISGFLCKIKGNSSSTAVDKEPKKSGPRL